MHAQRLATPVSSAADNLLITPTAKGLKPASLVLFPPADLPTELNLLRPGASSVDSPHHIAAAPFHQLLH